MSAEVWRQSLFAAAILAGLVALGPLQDLGRGIWGEITSPSPSTPEQRRAE